MEKGTTKQKKGIIQREFSSGGIVYKRIKSGGVLWLISKSTPSPDYPKTYWRLQKGWIDETDDGKIPGPISSGMVKATEEDLQKAALREVKEEGGINAKIIKKIGSERFFFNSKMRNGLVLKFVTFYLMEWLSDFPEGPGFETDEVKWLKYEKAREVLTHPGEKNMLDKAKFLLDSGIQSSLV